MNARAVLPALTVGALLLVGCASEAAEPPGLTASPTATTSPTPEPSPTPTDGIQVHDDPELGIVFEDVPDLTGDEAEVYNWVATYQKGYWQTLRTNEVSGILAPFTSADVQDTLAKMAADNAAVGVTIGGTFHTRISDVVVTGDTATAVKCNDLRDATVTTADGEWTAAETGQDVPRRSTLELVRIDTGLWHVMKSLEAGTC